MSKTKKAIDFLSSVKASLFLITIALMAYAGMAIVFLRQAKLGPWWQLEIIIDPNRIQIANILIVIFLVAEFLIIIPMLYLSPKD